MYTDCKCYEGKFCDAIRKKREEFDLICWVKKVSERSCLN